MIEEAVYELAVLGVVFFVGYVAGKITYYFFEDKIQDLF
jgi:hypothetical protein